jgi:predicted DNA-binding transcriptional regulator AlpA
MTEKISVTRDSLQTVTIPKFCELSGLCMKTVYNMMNAGKLKSVKIGRRMPAPRRRRYRLKERKVVA